LKPLLIIGASSFGRLMMVLAEECGHTVTGFIDDWNSGPEILGSTQTLGTVLKPSDHDLVLAIGYKHQQARLDLFNRLCADGFHFPALIHPTARISHHSKVGDASLIMGGVDVDAFSEIGTACVLWPRAVVSHDSVIGQNTFISPAATLCGFVTVGPGSFIGANSTLVDGSTLAPSSFVKAATRYHCKKQRT